MNTGIISSRYAKALLRLVDETGNGQAVYDQVTELYDSSRGRRLVIFRTAVPAPEMERRVKRLLEDRLGGEVVLTSEVDPALIGGFTLTIDDKLLDASVSSQLEMIRRQLMDKNKRIV